MFLLAGGPGSRRHGHTLLERVLARCPGIATPSVAYVGAASDDDVSFFSVMVEHLREAGAGPVTLVPLAPPNADLAKARAILDNADLVFMSGGDVEAGMSLLEDHQVVPWLHRLHEHGKPFLGLSAGSIMLGREWVRWTDPVDDTTAKRFPCLGLAPVLCDTHAEDDDWMELKALLRLSPAGTTGYGIPSGGGLQVEAGRPVQALGCSVARFIHRREKVERIPDLNPVAVDRRAGN